MTYYPYIINLPGWQFCLHALHAVSTKRRPHLPYEQPTSLEIALAVRIKDLELALRAVIDRVEGSFNSPRLRSLVSIDLETDVTKLAKAALEAPC